MIGLEEQTKIAILAASIIGLLLMIDLGLVSY